MKAKFLCLLGGCILIAHAAFGQQSLDHAALAAKILELHVRLGPAETAFLSPSAEDCLAYPRYTNTPGLGLIRLLPGEKYDDANSLSVRGGGSYYSFYRLTHEYGFGSDIRLRDGNFTVGFAGLDYGFFASLGEHKLEEISADSPDVKNLAQYTVPAKRAAHHDSQRSSTGLDIGGTIYFDHIKAVVNQTYVLRSVNVERSDVLVAFRVVREDTDGSLIIAWKMLKKANLEPSRSRPPIPHHPNPGTAGLLTAELDRSELKRRTSTKPALLLSQGSMNRLPNKSQTICSTWSTVTSTIFCSAM